MAKSICTDGVWAVMHFNASVESYRAARELGARGCECCHCHQNLVPELPYNPGESIFGNCVYCQKSVEYKTIYMTREIASYFDVRGGTIYGRPLAVGGIMHIVLPPNAEEFNALIKELTRQESVIVSPSESNFVLLDFVSKVINLTREKFRAITAEKRAQEIYFPQAPNIYTLSQSFYDFGMVVSPRPIAYSPQTKSELTGMVETAANDLEHFLLHKFDNHIGEDEIKKIKYGLLGICFTFIKRNWESKLETFTAPRTLSSSNSNIHSESISKKYSLNFYGRKLAFTQASFAMNPNEPLPLITHIEDMVIFPCFLGKFNELVGSVEECGRLLQIPLDFAPSAFLCPYCFSIMFVDSLTNFENYPDVDFSWSPNDKYAIFGYATYPAKSPHRMYKINALIKKLTSGGTILVANGFTPEAEVEFNLSDGQFLLMPSSLTKNDLDSLLVNTEKIVSTIIQHAKFAQRNNYYLEAVGFAQTAMAINPDDKEAVHFLI